MHTNRVWSIRRPFRSIPIAEPTIWACSGVLRLIAAAVENTREVVLPCGRGSDRA